MRVRVIRKVMLAFLAFISHGATMALAQPFALHCTYDGPLPYPSAGVATSNMQDFAIEPDGLKVTITAGLWSGRILAETSPTGGCYSFVTVTTANISFGDNGRCDLFLDWYINRMTGEITHVYIKPGAHSISTRGTCTKMEMHQKF